MEKRTQQGKLTNLEIASFCSEMAMILKSGILPWRELIFSGRMRRRRRKRAAG